MMVWVDVEVVDPARQQRDMAAKNPILEGAPHRAVDHDALAVERPELLRRMERRVIARNQCTGSAVKVGRLVGVVDGQEANGQHSDSVKPPGQQPGALKTGDRRRIVSGHHGNRRLRLLQTVQRRNLQQHCMTVAADHEIFDQARPAAL